MNEKFPKRYWGYLLLSIVIGMGIILISKRGHIVNMAEFIIVTLMIASITFFLFVIAEPIIEHFKKEKEMKEKCNNPKYGKKLFRGLYFELCSISILFLIGEIFYGERYNHNSRLIGCAFFAIILIKVLRYWFYEPQIKNVEKITERNLEEVADDDFNEDVRDFCRAPNLIITDSIVYDNNTKVFVGCSKISIINEPIIYATTKIEEIPIFQKIKIIKIDKTYKTYYVKKDTAEITPGEQEYYESFGKKLYEASEVFFSRTNYVNVRITSEKIELKLKYSSIEGYGLIDKIREKERTKEALEAIDEYLKDLKRIMEVY